MWQLGGPIDPCGPLGIQKRSTIDSVAGQATFTGGAWVTPPGEATANESEYDKRTGRRIGTTCQTSTICNQKALEAAGEVAPGVSVDEATKATPPVKASQGPEVAVKQRPNTNTKTKASRNITQCEQSKALK